MRLKLVNALTLYNLGQGDKISTQKMPISNKFKNFKSETQNARKVYFPKFKSSSIVFCFYGNCSLYLRRYEKLQIDLGINFNGLNMFFVILDSQ